MRYWRPTVVILGLIAFFTLLLVYLAWRSPTYDPTADHASFRTNQWGTKALRELCERNGLTTEQYRRPWDELEAEPSSLLCVFDPGSGPQKHEIEAVMEWVKSGGRLLVATDTDSAVGYNPAYGHLNANHVLLGYLGLVAESKGACPETVRVKSVPGARIGCQVEELSVSSSSRLAVAKSSTELADHLRKLVQDEHKLPAISPVEADERTPLLDDDAGVLVMRLKVGTGMIDVLSDADILGNGQIGQADNAVLAMNLIYARGAPATIYFDEYHHGRRGRPFEGERLPGASVFAAIWAILLCLAIYLSGSFWRFGQPVPLSPEPRRSLAEHVEAFAGLYEGAQATGAALTMIARRFESRLTALTGLGPAAPAEELARAVARAADIDAATLSQLLTELQSIDPDTRFSEAEMLRLVHRIAQFEEALTDGQSSGLNL